MIAIVIDDLIVRQLFETILQETGHLVVTFGSAYEALLWSAAFRKPELVLSNSLLPDMDGFQFKEEYFKRFPDCGTHFLVLTSLVEPDMMIILRDE